MTLDTLIIFGGAFVAVLPFLGFPSTWDNALFFLAGVFIIGLGIALRRRGNSSVLKRGADTPRKDSFSEENAHEEKSL